MEHELIWIASYYTYVMCILWIHESANIWVCTHSGTLLCHVSWIWLFEIQGSCTIPQSLLILLMQTLWSRTIWNLELPLWKAGFFLCKPLPVSAFDTIQMWFVQCAGFICQSSGSLSFQVFWSSFPRFWYVSRFLLRFHFGIDRFCFL